MPERLLSSSMSKIQSFAQKISRKIFVFLSTLIVITGGIELFEFLTSYGFKQNLFISANENTLKTKIDSIVTSTMNKYDIPGLAIGIVRGDSIYYTAGYGVRDVASNEPVTDSSVFHTASVSKLFTAMAVMKLINENQFTLETRVADLIPEIHYDDERFKFITIKQLLNHTSGLPDVSNYHWGRQNKSESALENYITEKKNTHLKTTPGASFYYSNMGYNLLGYIVQKKSKVSFEDYVKTNVLNPAKMYTSDFRYYNIPEHLRTSPHSRKWLTKRIYKLDVYPYTREHAPSSTLNSSAKELSCWMLYFLQLCRSEEEENKCYREMITPSLQQDRYIGLGFQLDKLEGNKTAGHYGGDKGFRSLIMLLPEKNIGLVVLGNCDYDEDYRQEILHSIARLLL
jgi:CubicO group peptidase (beta-lactamase class C family)